MGSKGRGSRRPTPKGKGMEMGGKRKMREGKGGEGKGSRRVKGIRGEGR